MGGSKVDLDAFEKKRPLASLEHVTLNPQSRSHSLGNVRNITDMVLNYFYRNCK